MGGDDFVTEEDIVLVTKRRVCAREPFRTVELVIVETELASRTRVLRAAARDAVAHVEDDETVPPVT